MPDNMITAELLEHQQLIQKVIETLGTDIERGCRLVAETLQNGNKVLIAGNGGSAADAQHIAAELTGRFVKERAALPGIALTVDTSALTAIAGR
jgi:D-sedoheptulose 7-phosphate isomerase